MNTETKIYESDCLLIVPARGGSKRIHEKNITPILHTPMIEWPLHELAKYWAPEKVLISTDNDQIASIAKKRGVETPYRRPTQLADDYTGIIDVLEDALSWFEKAGNRKVDYVAVVYPTAILFRQENMDLAFSLLNQRLDCDLVFSIATFPFPIQRALRKANNYLQMIQPENYHARSQDLEETFHDAGQFYVYRAEAVRKKLDLTITKAAGITLDRSEVIDIDTPEDLDVAQNLLKIANKKIHNPNWSF